MIDWRKTPSYPGDDIAEIKLYRGALEGSIRVQHYHSFVRVGAFLPGDNIRLPGDTPKSEPERCEHFGLEERADAERLLDQYLRDAQDAGWVLPLNTGAERGNT